MEEFIICDIIGKGHFIGSSTKDMVPQLVPHRQPFSTWKA